MAHGMRLIYARQFSFMQRDSGHGSSYGSGGTAGVSFTHLAKMLDNRQRPVEEEGQKPMMIITAEPSRSETEPNRAELKSPMRLGTRQYGCFSSGRSFVFAASCIADAAQLNSSSSAKSREVERSFRRAKPEVRIILKLLPRRLSCCAVAMSRPWLSS